MELREYLEINGIKQRSFAKKIGISEFTLHHILNRNKDIMLSTALAIEKETKGKVKCKDLAKKIPEESE